MTEIHNYNVPIPLMANPIATNNPVMFDLLIKGTSVIYLASFSGERFATSSMKSDLISRKAFRLYDARSRFQIDTEKYGEIRDYTGGMLAGGGYFQALNDEIDVFESLNEDLGSCLIVRKPKVELNSKKSSNLETDLKTEVKRVINNKNGSEALEKFLSDLEESRESLESLIFKHLEKNEISLKEKVGIYRYSHSKLEDFILSPEGDVYKDLYNHIYMNYSVPVLEEWIPYIYQKLISLLLIEELTVYSNGPSKIRAFKVILSDNVLKFIISEGIQSMEISFASYQDTGEEDFLSGIENVSDYLMKFAGEIGTSLQKKTELGFDASKDTHHNAFEHLNMTANKNGVTGYYPPQANTMMGVANALQKSSFNFLIGEMGITAHLKCG